MKIVTSAQIERNDLVKKLKGLNVDTEEMREFVHDNYPMAFRDVSDVNSPPRPGGTSFLKVAKLGRLPSYFSKKLNDQFPFDYDLYNHGVPLFSNPDAVVTETIAEYPTHRDRFRPASLNILVEGDPTNSTTYFEWNGGRFEYQYTPHMPTLFNTQVPHGVIYHKPGLRILISFKVSIGFQHFMGFLQGGEMFHDERIIRCNKDHLTRTCPREG